MIKSRSAAIRMLTIAFVLGGLVGGAATMLAERKSGREPQRGGGAQGYVNMLKDEIGLSATEEQQVSEVLRRHEPAMDSIWRTVRVQFETERQAVRREIRAVLTSEQALKYDALVARRDSIHRAREASHGNK
jgi:gas vesicle protein